MAEIPDVTYGYATVRIVTNTGDGPDGDDKPDPVIPQGRVIITPNPDQVLIQPSNGDPAYIWDPKGFQVNLISDPLGTPNAYARFRAVATDNPLFNPVNWTYTITFVFTDDTGTEVKPFSFELPTDADLDLAQVAPIASSDGQLIVRGPAGPAATFEVGNVTTGLAGSDAEFSVAADPTQDNNWIIDAQIPQGDKGDDGDASANAVETVTQTLTDAQKAIARTNIDCVASTRYHYLDHGIKGDWNGTTGTDDTAAIIALNTLVTANGGIIDFGNGAFLITGPVSIGSGVGARGEGGNEATCARFICGSATACVNWGYPSGGDTFHPTVLADISVDANGQGDPAGRLRVTGVKGIIMNVRVTDSTVVGTTVAAMTPGNGVVFDQAQNVLVQSLTSDSVQGYALVLDNGVGGCKFDSCHITTSGTLLRITDTSPGSSSGNGGGFPFGPADNTFDNCIFETRLNDSIQLLSIECGNMNIFEKCQFSASTSLAVMTSGAMVNISNNIVFKGLTIPLGTHCAFGAGCSWNGGAKGAVAGTNPVNMISIEGPNLVDVYGPHYAQDYANFIYIKANAPQVRFNPTNLFKGGGAGTTFGLNGALSNSKQGLSVATGVTGYTITFGAQTTASIGPADTASSIQTKLRGLSSIGAGNINVTGENGAYQTEFVGAKAGAPQATMTTTGTGGVVTVTSAQLGGAATNTNSCINLDVVQRQFKLPSFMPIGVSVGADTDSFPRIILQRSGAIALGDGTAAAGVGLSYDATNHALQTAGQFRITGGKSDAYHATAVTTAAFVFAADASAYPGVVFSYVNAACSLGTLTITNPVDGQLFTIKQVQPTPGGATYVWPPNVKWDGPIPNELGDGAVFHVTFMYSVSDTTWHEFSRSGSRQADLPTYAR